MQRNLKYLIAICAIALSACSTSQKLASTPGVDDDDVYYTQAKAGDQIVYADDNYQANTGYNNGYQNDDYYYYGDYASRINRFGYYSPFSMYNNFYYGYSPYNRFGWGGYGWNMGLGFNYGMGYGYDPFLYGGMYSPYFYDPYYASFYGYGYGLGYGYGYSPWGYGGYGYGYGGYGYGGGGFLVGGFGQRQNPRPVYAGGTAATSIRPGRTTIIQTTPGRRPGDLSVQSVTTNGQTTRAVRDTRTRDGNTARPEVQQVRPSYTPPAPTYNSGGGGGGNSGGGGGGGGRPVRP
nr:hypothetical protein [uncultured Mucilaginibacter sp.]